MSTQIENSASEKERNYSYDLGILSLVDSNRFPNEETLRQNPEEIPNIIKALGTENFRRLFTQYLNIKTKREQARDELDETLQIHDFDRSEYIVDLPEKVTVFPRFRPVPKEKPLTKWQKFALEKGIKKKKRSRMVYDDVTQDWVPRWGFKSKKQNEEKALAIIEAKPGEDPNQDPFEKRSLEKRLKKEKQKLNEMKNEENRQKGLKKAAGKGANFEENKKISGIEMKKRGKDATKKSLQIAQVSTASMGKFDKRAHKDEPTLKVPKRKIIPKFSSTKDERNRDIEIMNFISNSNSGSKRLKKD